MEKVVFVDKDDNKLGTEEKLEAHKDGGKLHRAISIFIFNSDGEMLLQKRANQKYHFPGRWTNACCSHPREGEPPEEAVHRRLREEFGFDTELQKVLEFVYKGKDEESELTEYEYDHTFMGVFDGEPDPNPEEIGDFRWMTDEELKEDVEGNPDKYTPWFKKVFRDVLDEKKRIFTARSN